MDSGTLGIILCVAFLVITISAKVYLIIKDEKRRKNNGEE